jgi:hypothetical protein
VADVFILVAEAEEDDTVDHHRNHPHPSMRRRHRPSRAPVAVAASWPHPLPPRLYPPRTTIIAAVIRTTTAVAVVVVLVVGMVALAVVVVVGVEEEEGGARIIPPLRNQFRTQEAGHFTHHPIRRPRTVLW